MVAKDNKKTDDFFDLIKQDQRIEDPFASDEIIFRDESGNLKVLQDGKVSDAEKGEKQEGELKAGIIKKEMQEAAKEFELPKDSPTVVSKPTIDIDKEVAHVVTDSGIKFNDVKIEKRFQGIVKSSLKKVRSIVQTREVFLGPMAEGGMGFDPQTTEKILSIIKKHSAHLDEKILSEVSQDQFSDLKDEVGNLLKPVVKEPELPKPEFTPEAEPNKSVIEKSQEIEDQAVDSAKPPVVEVEPEPEIRPEPEPISIPQPIVSDSPSKPRIQDVRFEPKLTGPVEEIRTMTLTDFRRLALNPRQAIENIIEKINILEEESFTHKTQAIQAWKEGNINKLYLEIGNQSMEGGKSISDIISARQSAGQETLTNDEVEAIIELNQKLRY